MSVVAAMPAGKHWIVVVSSPPVEPPDGLALNQVPMPVGASRVAFHAEGVRRWRGVDHSFNLLDARGVISVTERQAYIGRVRALAKMCADAFVQTRAGGWTESAA